MPGQIEVGINKHGQIVLHITPEGHTDIGHAVMTCDQARALARIMLAHCDAIEISNKKDPQ